MHGTTLAATVDQWPKIAAFIITSTIVCLLVQLRSTQDHSVLLSFKVYLAVLRTAERVGH
jgi:hypothetical protein